MKLLFIDQYGNNITKETDILPRIGDSVGMFVHYFPTVKTVLLYPSKAMTKELGQQFDAIITVG